MIYIVMEIQSNSETASTLVNSFTERNAAESKFHQILGAAAISNVQTHSAVLLTNTGKTLKSETYEHKVEDK